MTELTDTSFVLPGRVPVVIIGGGPVGCALGVELAHHGVAALVVDKDAVVPPNPVKAMLLNPRTLEQFRRWGLAETLRAAATTPMSWQRDVVFATSLTGREMGHFRQAFAFRAAQDSDKVAESAQVVMQPDTTRVLRDKLIETGGRLALGWSCVELQQDENGCTVELVEDATGRRHTVTSDYVAGCDGPQSLVRTSAGISRSGRGGLSANLLLHWRSPQVLDDYRLTPAAFTGLYHPHGNALCVPIDREHWCAHVAGYSIDTDINTVDVQAVIRRIVGEGIDFEVTFAGVYKVHERIADSYRAGRFFLAGDAAHLYAPFGGHNMNSGLGDAANLGWKLAAVLHGWGGDALLDTYQDERRPIAVTNATEASGNVARFVGAAKDVLGSMDPNTIDADGFEAESRRRGWGDALWAATTPQFLSDGITLDQRYVSDIVVEDGTSAPPWESTTYVFSSKPGHRAPHLWLTDGVSLYDQLAVGHTLLHHPGYAAQAAMFTSAAAAAGVPLATLELSSDLARARYDQPLTLVRPDLQVAWRGPDAVDAETVLRQISGHYPAAMSLPDETVSVAAPAFA